MNNEHIVAQVVLRAWPFGRGVSRIMNTLFPNRMFRDKTVTVSTTDGVRLKIFPNDLIGRHLYMTGEYERSVLDVLRRFAKPGDVLLDIGANIGYVSTFFLRRVPDSKVIAIEPQPGVMDLLRENLSQFPGRYRHLPVAMSDRAGRVSFAINEENLGDGRIDASGTITVETARGDDLLAGIDRIDLVKIDVQGHEEQVITSCLETIKRLKPRAILFEEMGTKAAPQESIGKMLTQVGYRIFGIRKKMLGHALAPISNASQCTGCNDYLALLP